MTREEWADFAAEVDNTFKGELTEDKEAAYARHLADLDVELARAAVRLLVSDGLAFMPAPGEIAKAAGRLLKPSAPPFSEAWPVIAKALDRLWLHYGSPEEKARRKVQIVQEVGAHLGEGPARWVERTAERLAMEPTADPDVGGVVLYRLGQEYEASCKQAAEDQKVGVALERANARALLGERPSLRRLGPSTQAILSELPAPEEVA